MPPQKIEIFKSLDGWAKDNMLVHLKPVEKCWQPQDFLPDPKHEGFIEQIEELRERAKGLPDEYFVVLVGDMVTEEALPTYQTFLNSNDGIRDETCSSLSSWAIWTRGWTGEENRHGDLLNKYLYLCGRVDMKQVEKTIQYLIGSGMDIQTENNPYLGFIYTSFQERATSISHGNTSKLAMKYGDKNLAQICGIIASDEKRHEAAYTKDIQTENNPYLGFIYTSFQERATSISHGNTSKLAMKYGDKNLAQICGIIASDEKRHEAAYTKVVAKLFEIDPNDTIIAFSNMMKKKISMPAHFMYDGCDDNLFLNFSAVAQRLGVYTAKDYADILEFLVNKWDVERLSELSSEGRKARDYVCELAPRIRKLEERAHMKAKKVDCAFSWIFNNHVKFE